MTNNTTNRRKFIKLSAVGMGIGVAPTAVAGQGATLDPTKLYDEKLRIVCIGAHPGDPEFGCGGTLAKYIDAGHSVTLLYLTKGEASDPSKTHGEMAALRTNEATTSAKILNATPMFAGQVDGNTTLDNVKNNEMTSVLQELNPDIVFTHWPVDTHPDHQVAGLLTLTAWNRLGRKFQKVLYDKFL